MRLPIFGPRRMGLPKIPPLIPKMASAELGRSMSSRRDAQRARARMEVSEQQSEQQRLMQRSKVMRQRLAMTDVEDSQLVQLRRLRTRPRRGHKEGFRPWKDFIDFHHWPRNDDETLKFPTLTEPIAEFHDKYRQFYNIIVGGRSLAIWTKFAALQPELQKLAAMRTHPNPRVREKAAKWQAIWASVMGRWGRDPVAPKKLDLRGRELMQGFVGELKEEEDLEPFDLKTCAMPLPTPLDKMKKARRERWQAMPSLIDRLFETQGATLENVAWIAVRRPRVMELLKFAYQREFDEKLQRKTFVRRVKRDAALDAIKTKDTLDAVDNVVDAEIPWQSTPVGFDPSMDREAEYITICRLRRIFMQRAEEIIARDGGAFIISQALDHRWYKAMTSDRQQDLYEERLRNLPAEKKQALMDKRNAPVE